MGPRWLLKSPSGWLFSEVNQSTIALLECRVQCVEVRHESPHSPIMELLFHPPLSADEQRWTVHASVLLPLFALYRVQSHCALLPNSALLYFTHSFVFRPQSSHRQHIVAVPSGRLRAWCKVYIHPDSTTLSFSCVLTFSLASLCTLGFAPHVTETRLMDRKHVINNIPF